MANHRRIILGPFQLITGSLIVSELLLGYWMLSKAEEPYERIVAGSLSIAVLIAFLVVFSVIYYIKKSKGDFDQK